MSTLNQNTPPANMTPGTGVRIGAGVAALALVGTAAFVGPRFFRGTNTAPVTAATAAAVIKVPEGEAGKVGDVAITSEAMDLAEIKIALVQRRLIHEKLAVSGVINAGSDRLAKITPRVTGKIIQVSAVVGNDVRAGQTLAVIESRELAQAQATYQQAGAHVAAAQSNVTRQRQLARLGAFGAPSVEQARTQSVDSEEHTHEAEHEVDIKQAALSEAQSAQKALETEVAQADTQVGVAKTRAARTEKLYQEELVSRQEFEQMQAEYKKAQSDLAVARAKADEGKARVASVTTQVAAAKVHYQLALKRARIVSENRSRQEKVFQGGFLTSKELVEAEAALRQAQLDQQAAAQAVKLLGGQPGGGSTVVVTSPITGRIQNRNVSLGQTVDTEHDLFTVVNLDQVVAELQVAPGSLGRIQPNQWVELTSETAPGKIFAGKVVALGTVSDESTRAVPVLVSLANRQGVFRPGAFVRGSVITDVRREQIVVPESAIQEHTGRKTVYVSLDEKSGNFEVRHVILGEPVTGSREVKDGLKGNERIAVNGTFYLKSEALKSSLSDGCCAVDTKGK